MKLQRITNDRSGHITLGYENGEVLSILWCAGSHTENCNEFPPVGGGILGEVAWFTRPWESKTVELMGDGKTIEKVIENKGWDNPTWMTPLEDLLDLLIELRRL